MESALRDRLIELSEHGPSDELLTALHDTLKKGDLWAVRKATGIIRENSLAEFAPALETTFERFMRRALKTDPGCIAKVAIVKTLAALDWSQPETYLSAIRHVQPEPVYGGREDTAAALRGHALQGLIVMGHPEAFYHAATLLNDPEAETRRLAAAALGWAETEQSELLLRMRVMSGDPNPQVISECLASLMQVHADNSLLFVARYLVPADLVLAESAAVAIGASHGDNAFQILRHAWQNTLDESFREMLFASMALTRTDEAVAFLIETLDHGNSKYVKAALDALTLFRTNQDILDAIERKARQSASGPHNLIRMWLRGGDDAT